MSHRRLQVESSLQKALGELISQGLSDPRIRGMISVTGVKIADDNRHARVSVSVLPQEYQSATLHGLQSAAKHLRISVREKVDMRSVPILTFELDDSLKKEARVYEAIQKAINETGPPKDPSSPEE